MDVGWGEDAGWGEGGGEGAGGDWGSDAGWGSSLVSGWEEEVEEAAGNPFEVEDDDLLRDRMYEKLSAARRLPEYMKNWYGAMPQVTTWATANQSFL